jgi:hypothetical protein
LCGEFGGFYPTAPESPEEKSSLVVTPELSKPAAQPSADVKASPNVKNDIYLTMPLEHVIQELIEA